MSTPLIAVLVVIAPLAEASIPLYVTVLLEPTVEAVAVMAEVDLVAATAVAVEAAVAVAVVTKPHLLYKHIKATVWSPFLYYKK